MHKNLSLIWYSYDLTHPPTSQEKALAVDAFVQEFSLEAQAMRSTLDSLHDKFGVLIHDNALAISAPDFHKITHPSEITEQWLTLLPCQHIMFISTDSSCARASIGLWDNHQLLRSFSADPFEIYENKGLPLPEERPFWAGKHPLQFAANVEPVRTEIPFHPLELADSFLKSQLGFHFFSRSPQDQEYISSLQFTQYNSSILAQSPQD